MVHVSAYKEACIDEERVLKQKSKIKWLREGDFDSAFFHNMVKGKITKNMIDEVKDEQGNTFSIRDIAAKFVDHFRNFFTMVDDIYPIKDPSNVFTRRLEPEVVVYLIRPIFDEEIKVALLDIDDNKASSPDGFTFQYHWGCKELNITSLCFADDLLMLFHGDFISASVLRRGLDEFGMSSGLYPNMSKSEAFFSNIPDNVIADIKLVMPFTKGNLPIRYLGVPLVSKGIKIKDCKVLIDIVEKRIIYWSSLFVLPMHVCDVIDKMFKKFLWNRGNTSKGMDSVAWKDVCKPKSEGGLGLKSVHLWNKALMVKHLWYILNRKESVWVKWVNIYRLKGKSIWDIELKKGSPWIGMDSKAKVADLIDEHEWMWPMEWDGRFDIVMSIPVPILNNDREDKTVWVNKKGKEVDFSVKEVWRAVKDEYPEVIWHKHVWFSQCIPRHSFILWVAIKGRLKTRDKLARWFTVGDRKCLLCNVQDESHSHLFFSCKFSKRLRERLKPMAKLEMVRNEWASVISNIVNRPANNTIWSVIQRIMFGAVVYFIWQERNIRRVDQVCRSDKGVFKCIVNAVRFKLMGLKLKVNSDVLKAAEI
ncbi:RNA-directed DNA polymerase, eukaryota, reverse transcriptase zinc-binding domain protein [Tanacetum coccineum]